MTYYLDIVAHAEETDNGRAIYAVKSVATDRIIALSDDRAALEDRVKRANCLNDSTCNH